MLVVFGLEDGGSVDVGYGYVIRIITVFTFPLVLTSINVLLVTLVLVYRHKYNIWLN
jgi:hypothetical protein